MDIPDKFKRAVIVREDTCGEEAGAQPESSPRLQIVDSLFEEILSRLGAESGSGDSNGNCDTETIRGLVLDLQRILTPASATQSRKCGGKEYRPNHILNAVLLADNLKAVPTNETDFLKTVTLQILDPI